FDDVQRIAQRNQLLKTEHDRSLTSLLQN
ncbi:hypothetical protein D046_2382B, partial [Vibrio parahaemolyticus V-223/04]